MTSETVKNHSLLTLHYRVTSSDGIEFVSTFGSHPATLQLGTGELAEPLEKCLLGMRTGQRGVFDLAPDQALGLPNPQLIQRLPLSEFPDHDNIQVLSTIEVRNSAGQQFSGIVRERTTEDLLVDFNHPLAGKSLRFEVDIIGIL